MCPMLLAEAIHIESRGLLGWLIVGLVAGWLAGKISKGRGFGILGNIIIGMLGALLGGLLFNLLGIAAYSLLGSIIMATIGSLVLLAILRRLKV